MEPDAEDKPRAIPSIPSRRRSQAGWWGLLVLLVTAGILWLIPLILTSIPLPPNSTGESRFVEHAHSALLLKLEGRNRQPEAMADLAIESIREIEMGRWLETQDPAASICFILSDSRTAVRLTIFVPDERTIIFLLQGPDIWSSNGIALERDVVGGTWRLGKLKLLKVQPRSDRERRLQSSS